jgi:hypothetical protein
LLGTPFNKFPALAPYKWALMYAAGALGVAGALIYDLDLMALAGLAPSVFGQVLTGIAVGGGANLIHQVTGQPTEPKA